MTTREGVALALVILALSGCRAHVALGEAPAPSAPLVERAATYEQRQPTQIVDPGFRWGQQHAQALRLQDGTIVEDPLDLAPLVPVDGATLAHAASARTLDDLGLGLHLGAIGVMTLTLGGMLAGGAMVLDNDDAGHLVLSGASLVGSLGALAFLLPALVVKMDAERERMLAFHAYEPELRARLALVPRSDDLTAKWAEATPTPTPLP